MRSWQEYLRLSVEAQSRSLAGRDTDQADRWNQIAAAYRLLAGELRDLERDSPETYRAMLAKDA
jgi:hypothetical protein